jgi:hypothetical protein
MQEPDDTGTNGFKVSGSTIVFSAAPATSSTFWAMYQGQNVDIGTPSEGVVSESKLNVSNSPTNGYVLTAQSGATGGLTWAADSTSDSTKLPLAGGTMTGNLSLGDSIKAQFGAGNDLQIYHDGSNSYIKDDGTGDLIMYGANLRLGHAGTGEEFLHAYGHGRVDLFYDNSVKLATTSTGIDISGNVTVAAGNKYTTVSGNDLNLDAPSTRSVFLKTGGSTALTIANDGNVGIGTSSPLSNLHVYDRDAPAELRLQRYEADGIMVNGDVIGSLLFHSNDDSANATGIRARIDAVIQSTAGQACIKFTTANSGEAEATVEKMRIQPDGKVGIGTSSPTAKLHVLGNNGAAAVKIIGGSTNGYYNLEVQNSASNGYGVAFKDGGSIVGSITTTGSATSYNTSSDYRLKENVVSMTGSIDRLKALNPSRFNFIADADTTVDGFLAHEAQEVVPEAITGTKDAMKTEEYEVTPEVKETVTIPAVEAVEEVLDDEGNITTEAIQAQDEYTEEQVVTEAVMGEREVPDYQGIDQSKLVPLLVASLQEAVARIEVLEAQLNA